jgi:hypothetical protein
MDIWQLLLGVLSVMMAIIGFFFIRLVKQVDAKLDIILCNERFPELKSKCDKMFHHRHAEPGGEVIIP